ncbi:protein-S-isoprenylcysteine O-methyltransferase [Thermoflexales bacterium]|nr:protein-S-isoprenylcysteine O-methyltransferase [Thermoflexales bacterium]
MLLRHLLSILLLPFGVVVIVPAWLLIAYAAGNTPWAEASPLVWVLCALGLVFLIGGLGLFSWCVSLFDRVGRGTLAPWDSTRHLVAVGPYRYIRNPMISGVAAMLVGEALLWGSSVLGLWAGLFITINHIYFVLFEEPGLEKRFGESYRAYKAAVPRWIPRLRFRRNI